MKFRIKKYPRGYVVEVKKQRRYLLFFKKDYWTHFISVAGIDSTPWYFKSYTAAKEELLSKVKWETFDNSIKDERLRQILIKEQNKK